MEQKAIKQMEKTTKVDRAAEKVKRAQAEYRKAVREQKDKERKAQDHHKFMMGGCVQKYFPEGFNVFDFNELEMNRIISCAFSLKDVQKHDQHSYQRETESRCWN